MRTHLEIATRLIVLLCCTPAAKGIPVDELVKWLSDEGIWDAVSPLERAFLLGHSPEKRVQFTWYSECAYATAWALNMVDEMGPPSKQAKIESVVAQVPEPGEPLAPFLEAAVLRSDEELVDARDRLMDAYAWCRQARSSGVPEQHGFDWEVAQERYRALCWIAGDEQQEWDEVTLDT